MSPQLQAPFTTSDEVFVVMVEDLLVLKENARD